eukprot:SAG22_NODE_745_length_7499_cov_2.796622_7_plen_225_part_00
MRLYCVSTGWPLLASGIPGWLARLAGWADSNLLQRNRTERPTAMAIFETGRTSEEALAKGVREGVKNASQRAALRNYHALLSAHRTHELLAPPRKRCFGLRLCKAPPSKFVPAAGAGGGAGREPPGKEQHVSVLVSVGLQPVCSACSTQPLEMAWNVLTAYLEFDFTDVHNTVGSDCPPELVGDVQLQFFLHKGRRGPGAAAGAAPAISFVEHAQQRLRGALRI